MAKPKVTLNVKKKMKDLTFWKENPNVMEQDEFDALKTSIEKFGLIIGGNHRATVWYQMYGDNSEIMCTVVAGLTKSEKTKLGLALNKIHGQNDLAKLKVLLGTMEIPGELLELGFDDEELKMLDVDITGFLSKDELFESPREIQTTTIICPNCGFKIEKTARNNAKGATKRAGATK
jgi:DNA-directed RNA polymerase subunit RPC12/RpoP